jgi:hypothetical protein
MLRHVRTELTRTKPQLPGFQKAITNFYTVLFFFVFEAKGVLSSSVCIYIQFRLGKACKKKKAGRSYSTLLLHNFIHSRHNRIRVSHHMNF